MLRKLSFAAAMLAAAAFSVAAASPLAPQSSADTDGSLVTLAKSGKGGGGKNGKGGGGGKGGKHHHRHRGGGAGVFIGVGYCAITAGSCADRYGSGTRRYYWCVRNAGC
jgi:hypothetical protein